MLASNTINEYVVQQAPSTLDNTLTSTNYDINVPLQTLFPVVSIGFSDYITQQRRDYLAQMSRIIKRIRKCVPYVYYDYKVLTTDIFKYYGSTTHVWIFLIYNGVN